MPIWFLTNPWVIAAGGSAAAYLLYKKNRDQRGRLKEAKLEVLEQQRTIDRLRAELGRERHFNKAAQHGDDEPY